MPTPRPIQATLFALDDDQTPVAIVHDVSVRAHQRRVKGPPPPTGAERKRAALDKHEADRIKQAALAYVRAELVTLYRRRVAKWPRMSEVAPYVNADDAARILRLWANSEVDSLPKQAWRGAIFAKGFTKTGSWTNSLRDKQQGAALPGWKPIEP